MRAVTGFGLRTPVVPRFRGSWLRRVLLVAWWVFGTWLPRPQGTPAATRAPDPPRTIPRSLRLWSLSASTSQRFQHRPERPVPPFLSRIPAGSGAAEPTPVDGGTSEPAPAAIHSADDVPAGPTHPAPQSPVPPVPPTPAAPSGPGEGDHSCPSSTHSGTHGPCGSVVAALVPSWALPPAGPAVLVSVGGSGATAGTPGYLG